MRSLLVAVMMIVMIACGEEASVKSSAADLIEEDPKTSVYCGDKRYEGDFVIDTDDYAKKWADERPTALWGTMVVGPDVSDISFLENVRCLESLVIEGNDRIEDYDVFRNLIWAKTKVVIHPNEKKTTRISFDSLEYAGELVEEEEIDPLGNSKIVTRARGIELSNINFVEFSSIKNIFKLYINKASKIDFGWAKYIHSVYLYRNDITSLNVNIEKVDNISLAYNCNLSSLSLDNLEEVVGIIHGSTEPTECKQRAYIHRVIKERCDELGGTYREYRKSCRFDLD